jgi:Mrp family chromosome partitioning ATPase
MEPSGRSRNVRVAVRRRSTPAPAAGRAVALFPLRRREIQSLYDTLQVCLARTDAKVLQLIGPRGGEGVSTIAHAFAHVCVTQSARRVLLLDASRPVARSSWDAGGRSGARSLADAARRGTDLAEALHPTAHPQMVRAVLSPDSRRAMLDDLEAVDTLWPELRERFDFIVVDSPPAIPTNEGIALAARADVVALVIEAERTRAALAREAQTRLSDAKANLVGVILNRRRHHIPRWLYRLL